MTSADWTAIGTCVLAAGVISGGLVWIIKGLAQSMAMQVCEKNVYPRFEGFAKIINDLTRFMETHNHIPTPDETRDKITSEQGKWLIIGAGLVGILWFFRDYNQRNQ